MALIAAARDKRIDGVVTLGAGGSTGADLVLAAAAHVLDGLKLPDAERQASIDLQKKIQAAVVSGKRLGGRAATRCGGRPTRRWFKSVLHLRSGAGHARQDQAADPRSSRAISIRRCRRTRPTVSPSWRARARRRRRSKCSTSRASITCWCRRRRAQDRIRVAEADRRITQ